MKSRMVLAIMLIGCSSSLFSHDAKTVEKKYIDFMYDTASVRKLSQKILNEESLSNDDRMFIELLPDIIGVLCKKVDVDHVWCEDGVLDALVKDTFGDTIEIACYLHVIGNHLRELKDRCSESVAKDLQIICDVIDQLVSFPDFAEGVTRANTQGSTALEETIKDKIDKIRRKVCLLLACAPIPIFGRTTITVSGHYCLANDIETSAGSPAITIAVSNVVVDLNGHTIRDASNNHGISMVGELEHIRVHNGFLVSTTVNMEEEMDFAGIWVTAVSDVDDLHLHDISIEGWEYGVVLHNSLKAFLHKVVACFAYGDGIRLENSECVELVSCNASENGGSGFFTDSSSAAIIFRSCVTCENGNHGFAIASPCSELAECEAMRNDGNGFEIGYTGNGGEEEEEERELSEILLRSCFSCAHTNTSGDSPAFNGNGFHVASNATNICLVRCTAKSNGSQFTDSAEGSDQPQDHAHGFRIDGSSCLIKECVAVSNVGGGFFDCNSKDVAPNSGSFGANNYGANAANDNNGNTVSIEIDNYPDKDITGNGIESVPAMGINDGASDNGPTYWTNVF